MEKHQSIMERYESGYPSSIDRKAFLVRQIDKAIEDVRGARLNDGELDVLAYEFVGED